MVSFVFAKLTAIMIMGIAEIILGILLILGILRGRGTRSAFGRFFGGIMLIAMGIMFMQVRTAGEIVVNEGSMQLKVPFQRDKMIRSEDIVSVIDVDYTINPSYRPAKKISGGNIKNVRTGWFRLASGTKAFVCIQGVRGLYIETELGFPVLVGTEDFEAFDAAFVEYVYAPPPAP